MLDQKQIVELPYNHIDRSQVGILAKRRIDQSLPEEQAKAKVKADTMRAALLSSPLSEEAQKEIDTLINEEWKVGKVEHSLTNGSNHEEWNPDEEQYVLGTDTIEHSRSGLAEHIVDGRLVLEEYEVDENDYLMTGFRIQDEFSNKNEISIDVDGQMVTVQNSDYSLWDTIEQMGMLLVRTNAPWKSGKFDSKGWKAYQKRRLAKKHNHLLALEANPIAQGDKRLSNAAQRREARLIKLRARRGGVNAKIGYNAFQNA